MTKRYSPGIHKEYSWYGDHVDHFPCMEENKNGLYVKYEAHNVTAKQLHNVTEKNKKLKAHIAVLEEELKNLKKS